MIPALAGVEFTVGKTKFQREIFSSAPDQVLVERLTSSTKGGLNFTMRLSRPASAQTQVVGNDTLVMTGNTDMPNLKGNLDYEVGCAHSGQRRRKSAGQGTV